MTERKIPALPTATRGFGAAQENDLPGITCPDPSIYLGAKSDTLAEIPPSRPQRRRNSNGNQRRQFTSRRNEDRDRADRLQAALLVARQRSLGPDLDGSPFDIGGQQIPFRPDTNSVIEAGNAAVQRSQ